MLNIDNFFSSLKIVGLVKKNDVWKVFKIKNVGQYYDLYLKTDVLLLCCVYEKFIYVCLSDYGLDPSHYFSSPGLSWDAMLKCTGIQLEKIHGISVYLFLEKE